MMNTDSSRSHTIMRLRLESSPRPDASDPLGMQPRTLSFLNIIDLAGSESAKVRPTRRQHACAACASPGMVSTPCGGHQQHSRAAEHLPAPGPQRNTKHKRAPRHSMHAGMLTRLGPSTSSGATTAAEPPLPQPQQCQVR